MNCVFQSCSGLCNCLSCLADVKNVYEKLIVKICLCCKRKEIEPHEIEYKVKLFGNTIVSFEKIVDDLD